MYRQEGYLPAIHEKWRHGTGRIVLPFNLRGICPCSKATNSFAEPAESTPHFIFHQEGKRSSGPERCED